MLDSTLSGNWRHSYLTLFGDTDQRSVGLELWLIIFFVWAIGFFFENGVITDMAYSYIWTLLIEWRFKQRERLLANLQSWSLLNSNLQNWSFLCLFSRKLITILNLRSFIPPAGYFLLVHLHHRFKLMILRYPIGPLEKQFLFQFLSRQFWVSWTWLIFHEILVLGCTQILTGLVAAHGYDYGGKWLF